MNALPFRNIPRTKLLIFVLIAGAGILLAESLFARQTNQRPPNILFCIADDWGWPHAAPYGDAVVKTLAFNKLAKEGILFETAFVSSPSCTPSRGAILTGQDFWRLQDGADLWSTLDRALPVYPLLLEEAGYFVGFWRKAWGPGNLEPGGYVEDRPAGKIYTGGLEEFLEKRPANTPFCFWLGASDPHRPYKKGSGAASGIDIDEVQVPPFYPDVAEIRNDLADYYAEVERFDADVQAAVQLLEKMGELDNTIIVVTGDHGMPFPRCKANLYDMGTRVPLVIRWGSQLKSGKTNTDLVSLTDLAPTFLDAAGVDIPDQMTGKSLLPLFKTHSESSYHPRKAIVYGRERHTPAQKSPSMDGYPSRAIRTDEYLYIRNLHPERWPAGVPEGATHPMNHFADCDDGPTKQFLLAHQATFPAYFQLSFGQRPEEELYALKNDPYQLVNLADDAAYAAVKAALSRQLVDYLTATKDPRLVPSRIDFDQIEYWGKLEN